MYNHHYHPSHNPTNGSSGLTRYGSAPAGSLVLSSLVDSVLAGEDDDSPAAAASLLSHGVRFQLSGAGDSPGGLTSSESSRCRLAGFEPTVDSGRRQGGGGGGGVESVVGLHRSYGLGELAVGDLLFRGGGGAGEGGASSLFRHSSSPAGFLSTLVVDDHHHNGYSSAAESGVDDDYRRLKSQLSFSSREDSLSQFSATGSGGGIASACPRAASDLRFASWDGGDPEGTIAAAFPKRARAGDGETNIATLANMNPHEFNSIEMGTVEKLFQLQQEEDTVPCKIRAKRGCATHPRSIAERERRTRISEKLKKLQELVPNMDKQTNTADMLDLAVQHIKSLQSHILKLEQDRVKCTCKS